MATEWNRRFFDSTRGTIVLLLRRGEQTVNDLAEQLDLTDNAVRAHLAALERDRLVERAGQRRGTSKPSYAYRLTESAMFLFPQAYGAILVQLLETMYETFGPEQSVEVLRETGRRLAYGQKPPTGSLEERVARAADLIGEFGGSVDVAPHGDGYEIKGYSCPFSQVVSAHPMFCAAVQELLEEFIGASVQEHCERNGSPRCCFEIAAGVGSHFLEQP